MVRESPMMQNKFWRVAAVACLLLVPPTLAASTAATIRGTVTDANGSGGVQNVEILVVGMMRATLTDQNGNYAITNIAAGDIQLAAKKPGYQSQLQKVAVPATGAVTANFTLKRAPLPPRHPAPDSPRQRR